MKRGRRIPLRAALELGLLLSLGVSVVLSPEALVLSWAAWAVLLVLLLAVSAVLLRAPSIRLWAVLVALLALWLVTSAGLLGQSSIVFSPQASPAALGG